MIEKALFPPTFSILDKNACRITMMSIMKNGVYIYKKQIKSSLEKLTCKYKNYLNEFLRI